MRPSATPSRTNAPPAKRTPPFRGIVAACAGALLVSGCRDLSGFSTGNGSFTGAVVDATFVRSGIAAATQMCLTLDANHFQDGPGAVWTDDGRFTAAPLRPIPQIWSDPLSTLSFGEGRLKNFVYVLSATSPFTDGNGNDVLAVVSLMQSGGVEMRLLRGAPPLGGPPLGVPPPSFGIDAGPGDGSGSADAAASSDGGTEGGSTTDGGANDLGSPGPIFAIFTLGRQATPCSF